MAWTILLLGTALADDPLATARALAEGGRPAEAIEAFGEALARTDLTPEQRAEGRYKRALLLERDLDRPIDALLEYELYLRESRGVLPRTTRVVEDNIAAIEAALGPDRELVREVVRQERGSAGGTQEEIRRLRALLARYPGSEAAARGYLALARLYQGPGVEDWKLALRALDSARNHGADKDQVDALRRRASREFLRSRIHAGCVAVASLLLSATLCLAPWRAMRREDWTRALRLAVPGLALAAAWAGLWWVAVRKDPESPITAMQGPVLIAMAVVVQVDLVMLTAALRGGRGARILVPTVAFLLSLAGVGIFCWRFDSFHLFGL